MQDKNRFIKINFEKADDQIKLNKNKVIHILFYTEKNILLSEGMEQYIDLLNFLNSFLNDNLSNNVIVRSEKGTFLLVKRKFENTKLQDDYLEQLGGRIYNSIKSIGCKEAIIYENDKKINQRIALGILLSSYKFSNYKKIKPSEENNLNSITFKYFIVPKKQAETFL